MSSWTRANPAATGRGGGSDDCQGWGTVPDWEDDEIWRRFVGRFQFRPSMSPSDWPGIAEPTPSITWDLAESWSRPISWPPSPPPENGDVSAESVDRLIMSALRDCTEPGGYLYVLNWLHPSLRVRPHEVSDEGSGTWPVSVFPHGNYHVFLAPDLRFGVFGHPWEATLCVFGDDLVRQVGRRNAGVLRCVHRRGGRPVSSGP